MVVTAIIIFVGFAEGYSNITEVERCYDILIGYDHLGNTIGYDFEQQEVCIDVVAHYQWEQKNK